MNASVIRGLIEAGYSDEAIDAAIELQNLEANDSATDAINDAGWTDLDEQLMRGAWRDVPMTNDAGEWL